MTLTRVYRFAASHRLHSAELSDTENEALYGKCNHPYGHGHDYVLHVTVAGEPDETTGRIVDIGALDRYVQQHVLRIYDHSDLNQDVPDFIGVPTTENLAIDSDRRLRRSWPFANAVIDRVIIHETGRNSVELRKAN